MHARTLAVCVSLILGTACASPDPSPEVSAEEQVADWQDELAERRAAIDRTQREPLTDEQRAERRQQADERAAARSRTSGLTAAQRNAARSANAYLQFKGFSRLGLIEQLSSEYGDQYSVGDATAAVDSLSVDWNAQAARSAVSYLDFQGFSCRGLIEQLSSEFGDQYTVDQATHGATQTGIC